MQTQYMQTLRQATVIALLALLASGPAQAVDGVIEINQVRAKAGGVTPGDTPLFPVTISQPGSYRLTGNLDVTDASARPGGTLAENTTAIQVTADDVTIDLNGFMIKGPTACSGKPPTCSPTGSGRGIDASTGQTSVAVMNGSVRGMGADGLLLNRSSTTLAEKVRALSNGGSGITANAATNCAADSNQFTGIDAFTVTNCTAAFNGSAGINTFTAANCTASNNGGQGINTLVATDCHAFGNIVSNIFAIGVVGHNICGSPPVLCP